MTRLGDLLRREPKPGLDIPAWLERLASVGIVTTDLQVARRQRITNVAAFAGAANALSHLATNALHDFDGLMVVHVYNVLFAIASLLLPRLHRYGDNTAAIALVILVLCGNTFVVWMVGTSSHLQIYFTLAGAMLLFFGVQNWRLFLVFFAITVAVLLFVINFAPVDGLVQPHDVALRNMLTSHAMINTITINALMIFYALTALRHAEVELENQYARSEALITTMLPASIAERLKSSPDQRVADRIDCLSVLFADLVGFTTAARGLSPDEVVEYLDGLVRGFDALSARHGVEKIKTIGDCYMAVAGLDGDGRAGAIAVGRLALDMLETIRGSSTLAGQQLGLRIGIHCGPATAGVIGDTRFSYDVWGDAVNIAARMESHGVPHRIHASDVFRDLTKDTFAFNERGATDIKDIGIARTFFLTGAIG